MIRARLRRLPWRDPVPWLLVGMMVVWGATFVVLGARRHDRFGTFGFDLGIYDQAIWLMSRLRDPFITIRGLEFFGHHMNPALVVFVPFYWLGAGPHFLLVAQVAVQAAGAGAIYLLARDRLADRWLALALAAVLLLQPSYQFFTWEFFHPDALAVTPLLYTYWAARTRRWPVFVVAGALALACKEDVALPLIVIGGLVALRGDRRLGAAAAAVSALWFVVATRVLIPAANGIGPFYDTFFGEFGTGPASIVGNVVAHPGHALSVATRHDRITYYRMMLSPVALLPLLAPDALLVAAPMLAVNALSSFPYQREIRYHYAALVVAGVILATVEAIALLGRNPGLRRFLVGLVVTTSFGATVAWGPSPLSTKFRTGYWPAAGDARLAAKREAVATVAHGESVSAIYNFVPHLSHRAQVYEFPVPWRNINWGVKGEHLDDPATVRWIAVDRTLLGSADRTLLDGLLAHEFRVRYDHDDILVAERVAPPGR